jgi:hypothetical protein
VHPKLMKGLAIGRMVWYRSKVGGYDMPAIITATVASLNPEGVRVWEESHGTKGVPPVSDADSVHLTVFSPGIPGAGPNRPPNSTGYDMPSGGSVEHASANLAGTYQEWDVPFFDAEAVEAGPRTGGDLEPTPGTWRWPEHV